MINMWFWVWVGLAVMLAVGEMFTAGFFMLPFSIGAAVAAALEYFFPGTIGLQWAAFVGLSSLLLVVMRRFSDRITHDSPQQVAGDRLLGRTGVVLSPIAPDGSRGMVRVDREEWRADHHGAETLGEGARVRVVSVVGTHLVVEPADDIMSDA